MLLKFEGEPVCHYSILRFVFPFFASVFLVIAMAAIRGRQIFRKFEIRLDKTFYSRYDLNRLLDVRSNPFDSKGFLRPRYKKEDEEIIRAFRDKISVTLALSVAALLIAWIAISFAGC